MKHFLFCTAVLFIGLSLTCCEPAVSSPELDHENPTYSSEPLYSDSSSSTPSRVEEEDVIDNKSASGMIPSSSESTVSSISQTAQANSSQPTSFKVKRAYVSFGSVPDVVEFELTSDQIASLLQLLKAQEYTQLKPVTSSNNPGGNNEEGIHLVYEDSSENQIGLFGGMRDGYLVEGGKGTDELIEFIWSLDTLKNYKYTYRIFNSYIDARERKGLPCTLQRRPTPEGMPEYPAFGVDSVTIRPEKSSIGFDLTEEQIKTMIPLFRALEYTYTGTAEETPKTFSFVVIIYTDGTTDRFSLSLDQINSRQARVTKGGDELMLYLWSLDSMKGTGLESEFINAYIDQQEAQGISCTLERRD